MKKEKTQITKQLMQWYESHARILPWRADSRRGEKADPYRVWISEIMLQQTRVEAVKEYFQRFMLRLPDVKSLAEVPEDELMKLWQGLGYYNRARNLQKAAKQIMDQYNGRFPEKYEILLQLPGIGEYTAGAIASIAFDERVPAVDGNVYRIYTRLMKEDGDITKAAVKRRIRDNLQEMMPQDGAGAFNQAWMDLGSAVCLPTGMPLCAQCPLQEQCKACHSGDMLSYPVKPDKKKRKKEQRTILLLEYQGKYLLQKRPPRGLLAGLWEFPSQEGYVSVEQMQEQLKAWQTVGSQIELLGKGQHIFSHIEWHMLGYLIHLEKAPELMLPAESVWVDPEEMERRYSIPSAFRCYYDQIMHLQQ